MTGAASANMGGMAVRIVYLGNLVSVARALSSVEGVSLVACVTERDDQEVPEFKDLARELKCAFFAVHGRKELGAALRSVGEIDLGIIANFGIILTKEQIALAKRGFVNAHLGLLPEYPGRNPIREAIQHAERVTGVTLHRVTPEVDRGPVLHRRMVPLSVKSDGGLILDRLCRVAGEMLVAYLCLEVDPARP